MELEVADSLADSPWDANRWDAALRDAAEELEPLPTGERQWDLLLAKFEAEKVKVSLDVIKSMPIQSIVPLHFRRSSNVHHPPRDVILWRYDREKWAFLDEDRAAIVAGPRQFIDMEIEEIENYWDSNPSYLWPPPTLFDFNSDGAEVEVIGGSPRLPSLPCTFELDCRECRGMMPCPQIWNLYTRYDRAKLGQKKKDAVSHVSIKDIMTCGVMMDRQALSSYTVLAAHHHFCGSGRSKYIHHIPSIPLMPSNLQYGSETRVLFVGKYGQLFRLAFDALVAKSSKSKPSGFDDGFVEICTRRARASQLRESQPTNLSLAIMHASSWGSPGRSPQGTSMYIPLTYTPEYFFLFSGGRQDTMAGLR